MKLAVFLVNTICRPINALLALADRDVCRWAQDTDEDETGCGPVTGYRQCPWHPDGGNHPEASQ